LGVTGCLDSSSRSEIDAQQSFVKSQSVYYSNLMQNYSLLSETSFTKTMAWINADFSSSAFIDLSSSGAVETAGFEHLASGYCVNDTLNPTTVKLITWFNSVDKDGHYRSPAQGATLSSLLAELSRNVSGTNLGLYSSNNAVKFLNEDRNISLFTNCEDFSGQIPVGAPVIVTDLPVPEKNKLNVVVNEYRAMPCDLGQQGHIVQKAQLPMLPNGHYIFNGEEYSSIPEAAWNDEANYCYNIVQARSFETQDMTVTGTNIAALGVGNGNSVENNIRSTLTDIDCKGAASFYVEEDTTSVEGSRTPPTSGAAANNQNSDFEEFDTCGTDIEIEAVNAAYTEYDRTVRLEQQDTDCGGVVGSYPDTHLGFDATVDHTAWSGNVRYEREIQEYRLLHSVSATSMDGDRQNTGPWYGVNIMCTRDEVLTISCDEFTSTDPDITTTFTDNRGFVYRRTNTIDGWQDASNLVHNPADEPAWVYDAANSGCAWTEQKITYVDCGGGPPPIMGFHYTGSFGGGDAIEERQAVGTSPTSFTYTNWVATSNAFCFRFASAYIGGDNCGGSTYSDRQAATNGVAPSDMTGPAAIGSWVSTGATCEGGGAASTAAHQHVWVPQGYSFSRYGGFSQL
jgi:hypothetical protein